MRENKETILLAEIRELLKDIKEVLENAIQIGKAEEIPLGKKAKTG